MPTRPRTADELASNRQPRDAMSGRATRRQNWHHRGTRLREHPKGTHRTGRLAAILDSPELQALISAPDALRWTGRPGHGVTGLVGHAPSKAIHALPTCSRTARPVAEHPGRRRSSGAPRAGGARYRLAKLRFAPLQSRVRPRSLHPDASCEPEEHTAGGRRSARGHARPRTHAREFRPIGPSNPPGDSLVYAASRRRSAPRPRRAAFSAPRTVSPTRWPASWWV